MSILNPYEKYLDARPVETILAATPVEIAGLLAAIDPEKAALRPSPDKWSAAEIVCHLADCEADDVLRLRRTLAEEGPTLQLFDQEKWAGFYPGVFAQQALEVFSALRGWNLLLIRRALPNAATRLVSHPKRGTITFKTLVETMAGHDLNHLNQLRALRQP